jgi:hypothetical protein
MTAHRWDKKWLISIPGFTESRTPRLSIVSKNVSSRSSMIGRSKIWQTLATRGIGIGSKISSINPNVYSPLSEKRFHGSPGKLGRTGFTWVLRIVVPDQAAISIGRITSIMLFITIDGNYIVKEKG